MSQTADDSFKASLHQANVSDIFDEQQPSHFRGFSDEETQDLTLETLKLAEGVEAPRTPGAGVIYRGNMRGVAQEENSAEQEQRQETKPESSERNVSRENELILERDRLRTLNEILEDSIQTFTDAQAKIQVSYCIRYSATCAS